MLILLAIGHRHGASCMYVCILYLSAAKHSYATKKTIYKTQTGMLKDYQVH